MKWILLVAAFSSFIPASSLAQGTDLDKSLAEVEKFNRENPMTAGEYLNFLKSNAEKRKNHSRSFLKESRESISAFLNLTDDFKFKSLFATNPDYNEAILGCLLAKDQGFPIPEPTLSDLSFWTNTITVYSENSAQNTYAKALASEIVASDNQIKLRLGIPTEAEMAEKLKLADDSEILKSFSHLDPNEIFSRKKWSGTRPKADWESIEREIADDPEIHAESTRGMIYGILGVKPDASWDKLFSEPRFNHLVLVSLSIVGNGYSLTPDERISLRQSFNARTGSVVTQDEYKYLTTCYAVILRGDDENRKKGK